MADMDEDTPIASLHPQSLEDNDPSDETQDFRLLAALNSKSGQLPKRGEKDFEPHGTKHQDGILAASREAMHDALAYTRFHNPKNHIRGFYYGDESLKRDEVVPAELLQGLDEDHCVVVHSIKGPHFKTMGKSPTGTKSPSLWLLPEEALYLVERGNLDLWWPTRSSFIARGDGEENGGAEEQPESSEKIDDGAPMSLQAAYAMLIGNDGQRGKVSLDRYTVYANLKRNGYVVFRAPEWDPTKPGESHKFQVVKSQESTSLFTWLFDKLFVDAKIEHPPYGPLVKPGMYRSYNAIYQQIAIVPRHKPSPVPENPSPPAEDPYRVVFHLWKPTNTMNFAKTNPGLPDFRVAITDARTTFIPSLPQLTSLLESTPWDPPRADMSGPTKVYHRLRHGWRNVVLAVVDQGVISYLRLGETGFGEEKLSDRFDEGSIRGNKRGGGAGPGRGRGRGRGRR
ncbi:tRNA-splicing endonuclease subunit sen54 N-term-domain-containing protein [Tricladium varicosporioides]|nr:tRNA-splicing endonuclease subunit sen54 N-term-domain-containing protein [Hymenoscyphus varicosporioides]